MTKYTCPCCWYKTLSEKPWSYEICPICFWEDDLDQSLFPDLDWWPNYVTLIQAQQNYIKYGVCEIQFKDKVRLPNENDIKDPAWRIIEIVL